MAPLIDVVFLLIIFFMCVSQFTRLQVEKLQLPEADSGEGNLANASIPCVLNVREDGRIVFDGRTYSIAHLPQALQNRYKVLSAENAPAVVIRGDRRVPWKTASALMEICAAQGFGKVRVAVQEKSGKQP